MVRAICRLGHGEASKDAQEGRAAFQDFQGPGPVAGRDARFRQDRWVQGRTSEGRGKRYPDRGNCEGRYDLYIGVHATLSSSVHASVHDIEGQVVYSDDGQIEAFSRAQDIEDVPFVLVGAIEVLLDTSLAACAFLDNDCTDYLTSENDTLRELSKSVDEALRPEDRKSTRLNSSH